MLESVIKSHIKYYPQTLLEECKYEIKKKKMGDLIDDFDLNPSDVLVNLIMDLIIDLDLIMMNLIINLIMNFTMINFLKDKTVF